jgi:hypothetical protein
MLFFPHLPPTTYLLWLRPCRRGVLLGVRSGGSGADCSGASPGSTTGIQVFRQGMRAEAKLHQ